MIKIKHNISERSRNGPSAAWTEEVKAGELLGAKEFI